jgi:predicted Zn-dependent protease
MTSTEQQEMYKKGVEAVDTGDTRYGLLFLENLFNAAPEPKIASYYAVCLAKERRDVARALELCDAAIADDPGNPVHYLNLGRIHLAAGMKREAIKAFRDGLLYGKSPLISRELEKLGWRDLAVIPSLGREHLVNRMLGKLLRKLRLK